VTKYPPAGSAGVRENAALIVLLRRKFNICECVLSAFSHISIVMHFGGGGQSDLFAHVFVVDRAARGSCACMCACAF